MFGPNTQLNHHITLNRYTHYILRDFDLSFHMPPFLGILLRLILPKKIQSIQQVYYEHAFALSSKIFVAYVRGGVTSRHFIQIHFGSKIRSSALEAAGHEVPAQNIGDFSMPSALQTKIILLLDAVQLLILFIWTLTYLEQNCFS